jgi:hypothetical protein
LADPPEIGISKVSEDAKKSNRRLFRFRQLPSHAKAVNKIYKVFSLGHGSWVWARIAKTCPIALKQASHLDPEARSGLKLKYPLGLLESSRYNIFQGGGDGDGRGYSRYRYYVL